MGSAVVAGGGDVDDAVLVKLLDASRSRDADALVPGYGEAAGGCYQSQPLVALALRWRRSSCLGDRIRHRRRTGSASFRSANGTDPVGRP